jgi:hypothetical protein
MPKNMNRICKTSGTIKGPNLQIIGIEGGEEIHAKSIDNLFNTIITKKQTNKQKKQTFPNLKKEKDIQV